MSRIPYIRRLFTLILICVCQINDAQFPTDTVQFQIESIVIEETLYQDQFDSVLSHWIIEQMPGGSTMIKKGRLEINDSAGCTVWLKNKLAAPVLIEYEVTLIRENGINDRVSDLNCFWMALDPENPDNMFLKGKTRSGKFSDYHCLRLYYVGYGANNNTTTRFRRYPGDCSRPLMQEINQIEYMNVPNAARRIQIISAGKTIVFLCDGKVVFHFNDPEPFTEGWFGFRTVNNHMAIDNFKVHRIRIDF